MQAILFADEGEQASASVIGLIAQLDRVAIRPERQKSAVYSDWQYSNIGHANAFVDATAVAFTNIDELGADNDLVADRSSLPFRLSTAMPDQQLQRMAMDLAGVGETALWVGNNRVDIHVQSKKTTPASPLCSREYRWMHELTAVDSLELRLPLTSCPEPQSLGALLSWQQYANTVFASVNSIDEQGQKTTTPLQGFAWLRQTWGSLPTGAGAVLIDTLQIRIDAKQWLDISRSKRTSGRGPRTVVATLYEDTMPVRQIDLDWQDDEQLQLSTSGAAYPQTISLRSNDDEVDVQVRVMNRLSEAVEPNGKRLRVPVLVTGSHSGAGFLSFNAMPDIQ